MAKTARLDSDGLTLRESLFVRHYLANNGNGKQAAIAAGYKREGSVQAAELLKKSHIQKVIDRERRKILGELDVTVKRTIRELARCAFLDPRALFGRDGMLKPIPQLSADAAACIASFDFRRTLKKGAVSRLRLVPKLAAVDMLGRYLNMWMGKGDHEDNDRLDEVVDAIRKSPAGRSQNRDSDEEDD